MPSTIVWVSGILLGGPSSSVTNPALARPAYPLRNRRIFCKIPFYKPFYRIEINPPFSVAYIGLRSYPPALNRRIQGE
jgi:hypothetical protein